jgi:hypothetical protein
MAKELGALSGVGADVQHRPDIQLLKPLSRILPQVMDIHTAMERLQIRQD